jgi:hypothetical protein
VTNSKFISKYFACPHEDRHYGNLLTEGGVLFSYGHHFPLAVPIPGGYLLNGDRYSVTTTQHQGETRDAARQHDAKVCIIPFSALNEAIPETRMHYRWMDDFKLLDITEDETREVPYTDEDGAQQIRYEHLLGSALFEYRGDYFLSSTDPSGKWGRNYFLTKLVEPAKTVAEAYESLKPKGVKIAEAEGIEVKRQGEYFFIPATYGSLFGAKPLRFPKAQVLKSEPLPPADTRNHPHQHVPTETVKLGEVTLCRGTVRHRGESFWSQGKLIRTEGDHKMLKLGKVWHIAVPNVQAGSWSVNGRVD